MKWNDAELCKQVERHSSWVVQGIKQKHKKLYDKLKIGLKVYADIQNGDKEDIVLIHNDDIKIFCICNRFSYGLYKLLLYAKVKNVEELIDNDSLRSNWDKVKGFK